MPNFTVTTKEEAIHAADFLRELAVDHEEMAREFRSAAVRAEGSFGVGHPCHLCGQRECGH